MIATLPLQTARLRRGRKHSLHHELEAFNDFGTTTSTQGITDGARFTEAQVPVYLNEFWTSKQRAANRLHEISYRACFKPQLPRFFIERLTKPGDVVFDPFMGRGTTLLEAALLGRIPSGCDANPLCQKLIAPRLNPPFWKLKNGWRKLISMLMPKCRKTCWCFIIRKHCNKFVR